jgi:ferredoxin
VGGFGLPASDAGAAGGRAIGALQLAQFNCNARRLARDARPLEFSNVSAYHRPNSQLSSVSIGQLYLKRVVSMPKIKFVNEKKEIECTAGENLRKVAQREGVELYSGVHKIFNCRGLGQCASCKVHVTKGLENVSRQGILEKLRLLLGPITFFARLGHEKELRLACQMRVQGDVEVETHPQVNWHGERYWG